MCSRSQRATYSLTRGGRFPSRASRPPEKTESCNRPFVGGFGLLKALRGCAGVVWCKGSSTGYRWTEGSKPGSMTGTCATPGGRTTPGARLPGSMRPAKLVGERLEGRAARPFGVRVGVKPPGALPNEGGGGGAIMPSPPERRPAGVRGTASGAAAKFSSMAAIGLASFDKLSPKILSRFAADITGSGSAISAASDEETRFSRPWPS